MNYYSDEQFADLVGDKIGNVKFFKRVLREKGLIGARQQLTDEHRDYFENILDTKRETHSTWETAINKVLSGVAEKVGAAPAGGDSVYNEVPDLLRQILETLRRIEQKL